MTRRGRLMDLVFGGDRDPFTKIETQVDDATNPNGVITATKGTILIIDYNGDNTDGDCFMNTDGSTGWVGLHDASA